MKPNIELFKRTNEWQQPRDLRDYEVLLGFNRDDLAGKNILDMGAHKKRVFARELLSSVPTANVVSLSPDFAKQANQMRLESDEKVIAATAEMGAIKDNYFDYIFDVGGPSLFTNNMEDLETMTKDEIRMLKPGGKIVLVIINNDQYMMYTDLKMLIEYREEGLEHAGIKLERLENSSAFRVTIQKK